MTRTLVAERMTPWLVIGAFCLTLSTLMLRDRIERPRPLLPEQAAVPILLLAR